MLMKTGNHQIMTGKRKDSPAACVKWIMRIADAFIGTSSPLRPR